MDERSPFELMESAWAARRAAFDLSGPERLQVLREAGVDLGHAAEMLRDTSQEVPYAHALHLRAQIELELGEQERAEELWRASVAVLRAANDPAQLAHKVRHLGDLELGRGRFERAAQHYTEALDLYRSLANPDEPALANALNRMALLKERIGETAEAEALWSEVRDRYADLGIEAGVKEAELHLDELR